MSIGRTPHLLPGEVAGALGWTARDASDTHAHTRKRARTIMVGRSSLVVFALITSCVANLNDILETAEEEAELEQARARIFIGADGATRSGSDEEEEYQATAWAANMHKLVMGDEGVDDEVLPTIPVGAMEAELLDATTNAFAALKRKQLAGGLIVEVLESQIVVAFGMESREQRKRRVALGLGIENKYASDLACRPINGTAMFFLVRRKPVEGAQPETFEVAFFDRELWGTFTEYIAEARGKAPLFSASRTPWAMRIHWNVMPSDQRVPFMLTRAELRVVARPTIVAQHEHGRL